MKRREFITLLGGSAALWPLVARAQRLFKIGLLDTGLGADFVVPFMGKLVELGYVEGKNAVIERKSAGGNIALLADLAADLVRQQVDVIVTAGTPAGFAAKKATSTIPIVLGANSDPVGVGLVASLARPSGNATGINFFTSELAAKRLQLLRDLVPGAIRVAIFVNTANAANTETTLRESVTAARALGMQVQSYRVSSSHEINAAFAALAGERTDALFFAGDGFFTSRRVQLVNLASRHAIPAAFSQREFAEIGGLMSYASNINDAWRQSGGYVGRVLKGAKPADLPVVQSNKFELIINHQTARMLGLTVPPTLIATADEVIE